MKKLFLTLTILFVTLNYTNANVQVKTILEGNINAKIKLIVYESLTCSHCADFHKEIYPELKKDFIDKGLISIEFRNFPLDLAAFNASKVAHCKNDGKSEILHFLFEKQKEWVRGETIEDLNKNLKKLINEKDFGIDFDKCIRDTVVEDHVLNDRINAVKKYNIQATPTLIINDKKFDNPQNYKKLKKTLEKLI
jgi:protein-disulfide isomerase